MVVKMYCEQQGHLPTLFLVTVGCDVTGEGVLKLHTAAISIEANVLVTIVQLVVINCPPFSAGYWMLFVLPNFWSVLYHCPPFLQVIGCYLCCLTSGLCCITVHHFCRYPPLPLQDVTDLTRKYLRLGYNLYRYQGGCLSSCVGVTGIVLTASFRSAVNGTRSGSRKRETPALALGNARLRTTVTWLHISMHAVCVVDVRVTPTGGSRRGHRTCSLVGGSRQVDRGGHRTCSLVGGSRQVDRSGDTDHVPWWVALDRWIEVDTEHVPWWVALDRWIEVGTLNMFPAYAPQIRGYRAGPTDASRRLSAVVSEDPRNQPCRFQAIYAHFQDDQNLTVFFMGDEDLMFKKKTGRGMSSMVRQTGVKLKAPDIYLQQSCQSYDMTVVGGGGTGGGGVSSQNGATALIKDLCASRGEKEKKNPGISASCLDLSTEATVTSVHNP
ncbi:hypothetical protein Btru_044467 [Bulinus truncatus]|nr:hypothetical protein Btru_044467 [Bulinus truncatus]